MYDTFCIISPFFCYNKKARATCAGIKNGRQTPTLSRPQVYHKTTKKSIFLYTQPKICVIMYHAIQNQKENQ